MLVPAHLIDGCSFRAGIEFASIKFIQRSFTEETKMTPQTVQYKELSESGNHDREFEPV